MRLGRRKIQDRFRTPLLRAKQTQTTNMAHGLPEGGVAFSQSIDDVILATHCDWLISGYDWGCFCDQQQLSLFHPVPPMYYLTSEQVISEGMDIVKLFVI